MWVIADSEQCSDSTSAAAVRMSYMLRLVVFDAALYKGQKNFARRQDENCSSICSKAWSNRAAKVRKTLNWRLLWGNPTVQSWHQLQSSKKRNKTVVKYCITVLVWNCKSRLHSYSKCWRYWGHPKIKRWLCEVLIMADEAVVWRNSRTIGL